jgi:hypothetical protein
VDIQKSIHSEKTEVITIRRRRSNPFSLSEGILSFATYYFWVSEKSEREISMKRLGKGGKVEISFATKVQGS